VLAPSRTRLIVIAVVAVTASVGLARRAPAQDAAAAAPTAGAPTSVRAETKEEARRLYERGQAHYDLGEYEQAIALFRKAYELTLAPLLLYNVAQAHRLNGDCPRALDVYRHFVRLAPDSPKRAETEGHIQALAARCGAGAPAASASSSARATPPASSSPAVASSGGEPGAGSWRRPVAVGLLVSGVSTGAAALATYLWNHDRWDTWSGEDRWLASPQAQATPGEWLNRQAANDRLLRSIHRFDTATVALLGASAACLSGAALLMVLPGRVAVDAGPGQARVAVRWSW
jgi:tetratricopeptide (TPR) repeat protein